MGIYEIFTRATLVILLKKRVFHFCTTTSGVEQCGDKTNAFRDCQENFCYFRRTVQHLELLSKNGKPSFFCKFTKVAWVKILCPLNKR